MSRPEEIMWPSVEQCYEDNFNDSKGKKKHFLFSVKKQEVNGVVVFEQKICKTTRPMSLVGHFATFPFSQNDFMSAKYVTPRRNYVAKCGTML